MLNKIKNDLSEILLKLDFWILLDKIEIIGNEIYFIFLYKNKIYKIILKELLWKKYIKKTKVWILIYDWEVCEFEFNKIIIIINIYIRELEKNNNITCYNQLILLFAFISLISMKKYFYLKEKLIFEQIKNKYSLSNKFTNNIYKLNYIVYDDSLWKGLYLLKWLYFDKLLLEKHIGIISNNIKKLNWYSNKIYLWEYKWKNYLELCVWKEKLFFIIYKYIDNHWSIDKLINNYILFDELIKFNKYKIKKNTKWNLIWYVHHDPNLTNFLKSIGWKIIIIDYKHIHKSYIILQPLLLFIRIYIYDRDNILNILNILKDILLYFCRRINWLILDLNSLDIFWFLVENIEFCIWKKTELKFTKYNIDMIILDIGKEYYAKYNNKK